MKKLLLFLFILPAIVVLGFCSVAVLVALPQVSMDAQIAGELMAAGFGVPAIELLIALFIISGS